MHRSSVGPLAVCCLSALRSAFSRLGRQRRRGRVQGPSRYRTLRRQRHHRPRGEGLRHDATASGDLEGRQGERRAEARKGALRASPTRPGLVPRSWEYRAISKPSSKRLALRGCSHATPMNATASHSTNEDDGCRVPRPGHIERDRARPHSQPPGRARRPLRLELDHSLFRLGGEDGSELIKRLDGIAQGPGHLVLGIGVHRQVIDEGIAVEKSRARAPSMTLHPRSS